MDDFADFYAAHFRPLTVQLLAYTGDLAVAQDVVQEAFSRAVPRWGKLRTYDEPANWVRRVAFNLATSRWRRARTALLHARRQREEHADGPTPDRVAIVQALSTLPENQRRAIVLHYLAGLTVQEIADQCDTSPGTVKSWLHRGRGSLATQLHDAWESHNV